MSVNAPKDPISTKIDPILIHSSEKSTYSTPPSSSIIKDSMESALGNVETSSPLNLSKGGEPQLIAPSKSSDTSTLSAFRIWNDAIRGFRGQLTASKLTNIESRSKFNQFAIDQAIDFSKLAEKKQILLQSLEEEIKKTLEDLQDQMDKMQELLKMQQEAIDQINAGNGEEKQQFEALKRAHDEYISKLKSLGCQDLGNGNFSIPDEPEDIKEQCNQVIADYKKAVDKFNHYWGGRSEQIKRFNEATAAYNQSVAECNKTMNDFIRNNQLEEFLKEKGISVPVLGSSSPRDLIGCQDTIGTPPFIEIVPSKLNIPLLPEYVVNIGKGGPPAVPKLAEFVPFAPSSLYEELYQKEYENTVSNIDQEMLQLPLYWSFVRENTDKIDKDLSNGDLLNSKILLKKLLSTLPRIAVTSSSSLAMKAMEMSDSRIQVSMGKALLEEIIKNSIMSDQMFSKEKEAEVAQLTDKLLVLSIGSLNQLAIQAELPSLGIIADHLISLPKDSPAFALLFSISLLNRISENIGQGAMDRATIKFIQSIPEFNSLTPEEIKELSASLNIGQLLVGAKLLLENMGLPHLLPDLLSLISSDFSENMKMSAFINEVRVDNQPSGLELKEQIKESFIQAGFSEEKAQYLAEVASDLSQKGLLTPTSPSFSSSALDRPLLEKSITASLVIGNYSLTDAQSVANKAINLTHLDGPYVSSKQFRKALESHLSDFGVKNSRETSMDAVILPPQQPITRETRHVEQSILVEKTLPKEKPSLMEKISPPERKASERIVFEKENTLPLSQNELSTLLQKRIHQLVSPHIGAPLAAEIGKEILKSLFGIEPAYEEVKKEAKTPQRTENVNSLAWSFLIKEEIAKLPIKVDQVFADAIHETFKTSIQTMESFYAFSRKLMDPAYLFVYAYGIIYGDHGKKKAIDIPI